MVLSTLFTLFNRFHPFSRNTLAFVHAAFHVASSILKCQESHRVENAASHAFRTAKHLEQAAN